MSEESEKRIDNLQEAIEKAVEKFKKENLNKEDVDRIKRRITYAKARKTREKNSENILVKEFFQIKK